MRVRGFRFRLWARSDGTISPHLSTSVAGERRQLVHPVIAGTSPGSFSRTFESASWDLGARFIEIIALHVKSLDLRAVLVSYKTGRKVDLVESTNAVSQRVEFRTSQMVSGSVPTRLKIQVSAVRFRAGPPEFRKIKLAAHERGGAADRREQERKRRQAAGPTAGTAAIENWSVTSYSAKANSAAKGKSAEALPLALTSRVYGPAGSAPASSIWIVPVASSRKMSPDEFRRTSSAEPLSKALSSPWRV